MKIALYGKKIFLEKTDKFLKKLNLNSVQHNTLSEVKESAQNKELDLLMLDPSLLNSNLEEEEIIKAQNEFNRIQFIANFSHEIRTPLNLILGMSELLRETKLTEDQLDLVNRFENAGEHLLNLMDDVLDIAKIDKETGFVNFEALNLQALFSEIKKIVEVQGFQKGVTLDTYFGFNSEDVVLSDAKRLKQVCLNLLTNAIKFTDSGKVHFIVELNSEKKNLKIKVKDSGSGIPEQFRSEIFNEFYQLDEQRHQFKKGTGLGLPIVKRLVESVGGQIDVSSNVPKGSVFTVTWPYQRVQNPVSPEAKGKTLSYEPLKSREKLNVLVVEDDLDNQFLIKAYLKNLKDNFVYCSNGEEALECLKKSKFDLVLLDLQMPIMDGFETISRIRRQERENTGKFKLPVVALTANAFEDQARLAKVSGFTGYITKPVSKKELFYVLDRVSLNIHSGEKTKLSLAQHTGAKIYFMDL